MIDEDCSVYIKQHKDKYVILSLYVDDVLIAGNDLQFVKTIKKWLSYTSEMKYMGETSYIHSNHSNRLVVLSQEHYINKILEWFNMQDWNPINTPFTRGENLSKEMGPKTPKEKRKISNVPYSHVVGSLMYATMCKRPYIYYVVGMVSRY